MARFAETEKALEKGLESLSPEKGVQLIEDWEEQLRDLEGAKPVLKDLGALKKALQAKEPDGDKIQELLRKLGQETVEAADQAEGSTADKVRDLGEQLQQGAQ